MRDTKYRGYTLISAAVAATIMASCASVPKKPAGSADLAKAGGQQNLRAERAISQLATPGTN